MHSIPEEGAVSARELKVRITVTDPPPGLMVSLHDKQSRPVSARLSSGAELSFEIPVRLNGPASEGRYSGEFVRTAAGKRYIYVAWGQLAGQEGTCWARRAKIMLETLSPALVEQSLSQGKSLEVRMRGKGSDGSPSCATVPVEWRIA